MIAHITSDQWIYFDNITEWEESILVERFSASHPNRRFIDDSSTQTWDGVYRKYSKAHKRLARPFLGELRGLCKKKDLPLVVIDDREPAEYKPIDINLIDENFLPGITLKKFQVDAIKRIYRSEVGVFHSPVSSGKTEIIAGICKAMRCPTVIIAEQIVVIDQIRQRLMLRDVCNEPGLFYAGKMPSGQLIIIGSIQSLLKPNKKPAQPQRNNYKREAGYQAALKKYTIKLKAFKSRVRKAEALHKLVQKAHMLLIDEADLATSSGYKDLFRYRFNGRRRYGFTGTLNDKEKPVQTLVLQEHLGSVIFKCGADHIEKEGLAVPLEYCALVYGEDGNRDDATAYDIAYNETIVYNQSLHKIFAAICRKYEHEGTLILVDRDDLGYALRDLIPCCKFIHGKTPRDQRIEAIAEFEKRELRVLIGGKNVRRGMDLKNGCENLILATGGKLDSDFAQRTGRARRINQKGRARVFDIFFLCNKYLYAHSRKRLKAACNMGLKTRVIFRDGIIDGAAFVRSRFRRPKFNKTKLFKEAR